MESKPLQDFDASWQQLMDIMVLPMNLQQYWDAFWADDAPYFVGAFDANTNDKIIDHTDWH